MTIQTLETLSSIAFPQLANDVCKYSLRFGKRQQFGINMFDNNYSVGGDSFDVAVDSTGNIYVVASRDGSTANYDGWMANYNASGKGLWTQFLGSIAIDIAMTVALDGNGNVYASTDWEKEKEKAKIPPFLLLQNYCCNRSI